MVFEGDPVLGFAVEKLRQEARLEQLLPAGGHKAASPVEVDVVGRGLGDPQDEIIGRRLGLRIFLPLEEEEIVDDVPGEGRLDFRLADKLLGEDPLEKTRGKESEEEKRNQGDGGEGDINAVGERPQGPETGAGLGRQPAPEQKQEKKGGRQRRVLEILHGQPDGRRTGDQNGLNPIRPAEGVEIEALVLVAESGPYPGSVQGGIAGQGRGKAGRKPAGIEKNVPRGAEDGETEIKLNERRQGVRAEQLEIGIGRIEKRQEDVVQ